MKGSQKKSREKEGKKKKDPSEKTENTVIVNLSCKELLFCFLKYINNIMEIYLNKPEEIKIKFKSINYLNCLLNVQKLLPKKPEK